MKHFLDSPPWHPDYQIDGMGVLEITPEQRCSLGNICFGIFADMSNAGAPFQEILMACYMSGVQHTLSTLRTSSTGVNHENRDKK